MRLAVEPGPAADEGEHWTGDSETELRGEREGLGQSVAWAGTGLRVGFAHLGAYFVRVILGAGLVALSEPSCLGGRPGIISHAPPPINRCSISLYVRDHLPAAL